MKGRVNNIGYLHINNLYKAGDILEFKKVYSLEKIHGTSAHLNFDAAKPPFIHFYSGGAKHQTFVDLFDQNKLLEHFNNFGQLQLTIYGEAYGGKMQGMKDTYGDQLRFVVFDVKIGHCWLSVPDAEKVAKQLK